MAEKKEGYTLYTGEYKGPKGDKAIHLAEKQGKEVETYKKGSSLMSFSRTYQQGQSRRSACCQAPWRGRNCQG